MAECCELRVSGSGCVAVVWVCETVVRFLIKKG